ncbi:MAG: hypothetical protein FWD79_04550 [Desulfobulbus sp.]|nr:hypothetical protein [Desulfobulbus sp.]
MKKIKKGKVFKAVGGLLLIGITAFIFDCYGIDIKWQEEVRMMDGEMLILHRTAKFGQFKGGDWSGPEGREEKEMSLEVLKLPANWVAPPVWRTDYVPILLDYQPQEYTWSVVATFYWCKSWWLLGGAALPYVEYQSIHGGPWQVIPLEERLFGRTSNLLTGPSYKGEPRRTQTKWLREVIPNYKETPNLVTAEETDWRNRRAGNMYRTILAKWDNNCSPFVSREMIWWQEEVSMADGAILLLHREASRGEAGTYGPEVPTYWLNGYGRGRPFLRMPSEKLEMRKLPPNWTLPPIWRTEYVPILLDYQPQEHIWSIVATHLDCKGWELLGRPSLPYVEYQSKDGGPWQIILLEQRLMGRKSNLFPGVRSGGGPELVTSEETDRYLQSADIRYQRVLSDWNPNSCSPNLEGK